MAASVACLLFGFAASVAAETMVVTVRDALERALENDDGLLQDRLSLRIAELELQATEESTYLPSIGLNVALPELSASGWDSAASGSLSVRLGLPWGTGGTISAGLSFDADLETLVFGETTWQLGLSETVDFGSLSSAADSLESKRQAVETAKRSVQDALGDLVRSVLTDYAEILSLQLQWESDSTSVESTAADLESVKQLIDGGFRSEADLVDARLRVLEAEIQVEKSRQAYEDAVETFRARDARSGDRLRAGGHRPRHGVAQERRAEPARHRGDHRRHPSGHGERSNGPKQASVGRRGPG